jgi:DNA (cytosine-5)-methyltransferase 1
MVVRGHRSARPTTDRRTTVTEVAGKTPRGAYGVKLVRGPFVRLAPHPSACSTEDEFLEYAARCRARGDRLAADLFCGAGGLSLGLADAGFNVILSADHDDESVETHRHHNPGLTVDWDLGNSENVRRVGELVRAAGVELLAGGPPCQPFSKAGRSMIRHRVRHGLRPAHDERRDLWRSFLEVIQFARPRAVIMENVPDMALDREMFILRTIVHELESIGYSVKERIIDTYRFGVPQFRQRLILVALRDGIDFDWPKDAPERVTVWNAIGDLPEVEGGWRPDGGADGWTEYAGPQGEYQAAMRRGTQSTETHRIYDHITRPVRDDDRQLFDLMGERTLYSDLPEEMRRYRADIFDDKYKRLEENNYSRTITAHIAKDGYWYIHPRQNRTLTVREAARLQTFPDRFRFAGPPSAAFRQIGNAVPPILGRHLATAVDAALELNEPVAVRTMDVARRLAAWFEDVDSPTMPWLRATTRWQVVSAELMLDRVAADQVRFVWPLLARWATPAQTAAARVELMEIARWIGREAKAAKLADLADRLADAPDVLNGNEPPPKATGVDAALLDLAVLAVPTAGEDDSEEPVIVTKGVHRVAARFTGGIARRNRLSDGRIAVAQMIGYDSDARAAHLALVELANSVCRPVDPYCGRCPLAERCHEYGPRRSW